MSGPSTMNTLVTGGSGLVGSSLCARLLAKGAKVFCVDNLTLGTLRHVEDFRSNNDFEFEKWDVSQRDWHAKLRGRKFDLIVHLAANSDISLGQKQPELDCQRTFTTTMETLLAAKGLNVPNFVFSSSSAVYGAEPELPTPETAREMHPVSLYGAGKLASEAFVSAFVETFGLNAWVYRFGNVVGRKLTHGVIYDFIRRLQRNPAELTVLGNGTQTKTYLDVEECVDGIFYGFEKSRPGRTHAQRFQVFNLSTNGVTTVREIAEETVRVVTGGKTQVLFGKEPIGWVGDVPKTHLAVDKMARLGWRTKMESSAAVFKAIRDHYEWSKQ